MNFDAVLNQLFQPYFYYSLVFMILSFVTIRVVLRYSSFMGQKTRSLLSLIPLTVPLMIMALFVPSTIIQASLPAFNTPAALVTSGTLSPASPHPATATAFNTYFVNSAMAPLPHPSGAFLIAHDAAPPAVTSFTGILCIIGLAAAAFFGLAMVLADDRIAKRILHVIPLAPGEHQWLQTKVTELSKKLSIPIPNVGLVEDLRPNAFTIGYDQNATIVFSIGLLNILSEEEIVAVASHEMAHIKNHDFFYKILSSTLTVVSFFNPLAYLASSAAQREREMLADESALAVLEKPAAFGVALAKICAAIQNLPKERALTSFTSNLLVTSSVLPKVGILSTHPRLDKRLRNISTPKTHVSQSRRRLGLAVFVCLIVVCSSVAISFEMVNLQTGFAFAHQVQPLRVGTMNSGGFGGTIAMSMGPFNVPFGAAPMLNTQGSSFPGSLLPDNGSVIFVVRGGSSFNASVPVVQDGPVFLAHDSLVSP
jgi:Zn-dependent protease with chaperone function